MLIEKEWICFGHKFRDRLGHGLSGKAPKECSPIFLQWIGTLSLLIDYSLYSLSFIY